MLQVMSFVCVCLLFVCVMLFVLVMLFVCVCLLFMLVMLFVYVCPTPATAVRCVHSADLQQTGVNRHKLCTLYQDKLFTQEDHITTTLPQCWS